MKDPLLAFFQGQDATIARIPDKTLIWIILAGFIGAAFLFGTLAGLVYGQLGILAPIFLGKNT